MTEEFQFGDLELRKAHRARNHPAVPPRPGDLATGPPTAGARVLVSDEIQERLQRAAGTTNRHRAYLGIATPRTIAHGTTSGEDPAAFLTRVGCLIKPMITAMLCDLLIGKSSSPDAAAIDFWPDSLVRTRQLLHGVAIHHLLNHTHGIDDSSLPQAPMSNKRIDVEALSEQAGSFPRLARPGRFYSYGRIGSWISASIAEYISEAPFETILLDMLGPSARVRQGPPLCAATGGGLEMQVVELLMFALREIKRSAGDLFAQGVRFTVPRPGFTAHETGTCLGWNTYRGGWLGHNSVAPGAPLLLRVHPEREVAVLVATNGVSPSTIVARSLADLFPELAYPRIPRLTGQLRCSSPERYCGNYRNAHSTWRVQLQADESLLISTSPTSAASSAPSVSTGLAPAEEDVFVATPAQSELPHFLEFIGDKAAPASHLWDGERIRVRA